MLIATRADTTKHLRAAFTRRLAEHGWREGVNIEYSVRYGEANPASYDRLAVEMVAWKPDLIFVGYGPFAAVVKKHTRDIPIVFTMSQDPVAEGVAASLAKPGGNATGTSTRNNELTGKRLQLLKEALPRVRRLGIVRRVGFPSTPDVVSLYEELKRSAAQLELQLVEVLHQHTQEGDFGPAFAQLAAKPVQAVATVINWNYSYYHEFALHAARVKLPTICDATEFVDAGGLMSLSIDRAERYRKSADYVNLILRGAKPADLPVDEPKAFELVVNLKTARALGLTIPPSVLLRADRLIG